MAKPPFQPLSPHINPGIMVSSTVAARSQAVIKYADNILKNFATSVSIVPAPRFSWLLTSANDCIQSQPWKDRSSSIYRDLFVGFYLFLFLGDTTTYVQCMCLNKHTYIVIHTYTYIVIHYIPTYLHTYIHTCMCLLNLFLYKYMRVYLHIYIYMYIYIYTHTIHIYLLI